MRGENSLAPAGKRTQAVQLVARPSAETVIVAQELKVVPQILHPQLTASRVSSFLGAREKHV